GEIHCRGGLSLLRQPRGHDDRADAAGARQEEGSPQRAITLRNLRLRLPVWQQLDLFIHNLPRRLALSFQQSPAVTEGLNPAGATDRGNGAEGRKLEHFLDLLGRAKAAIQIGKEEGKPRARQDAANEAEQAVLGV